MQLESRRLVKRHIALYRLFYPDAGLVGRNGSHVYYGTWLIPLGSALALIWLAGHTTTGTINKVGIDHLVIIQIVHRVAVQFARTQFFEQFVCHPVERCQSSIHCEYAGRTIDIDRHAGLAAGR